MRFLLVRLACPAAAVGLLAQVPHPAPRPDTGVAAVAAARARQPSAADLRFLRSQPHPTTTITDVKVTVNGRLVDIGDITATLAHKTNSAVMAGEFKLDPKFKGLVHWTEFHWVQLIDKDDCPAKYAGKALPMPVVDPPLDGWDYMYKDGATRKQPNNSIPNYGWFLDKDPWYYNATGEKAQNKVGESYKIADGPGLCPGTGVTSFQTWLVARSGKSICLIRGYKWTISRAAAKRAGPTDLGAPTAAQATAVGKALTNGKITGWTTSNQCKIKCPPPASGRVPPVKLGPDKVVPGLTPKKLGVQAITRMWIAQLPSSKPGIATVALTVTGLSRSFGGQGAEDFLTGSYDVVLDRFVPDRNAAALNSTGSDLDLSLDASGTLAVFERPRNGGVWVGFRDGPNLPFKLRGPVRNLPQSRFFHPAVGLYLGKLQLFFADTQSRTLLMAPLDLALMTIGPPIPVVGPADIAGQPNSPVLIFDARGEVVGLTHSESVGTRNLHYVSFDLDWTTPALPFLDKRNRLRSSGVYGGLFFDVEQTPAPSHLILQPALWWTGGRGLVGGRLEGTIFVPPSASPINMLSLLLLSPRFLPVPVPVPGILGPLGLDIGSGLLVLNIGPHGRTLGAAHFLLPVPNDPALAGLVLRGQPLSLDLGLRRLLLGNTGGLRIY